jgi:hypothetical protein
MRVKITEVTLRAAIPVVCIRLMGSELQSITQLNVSNRWYVSNQQKKYFFYFYRCTVHLEINLLSHTNKCTNYIIYYLKSVLIIDIKTLPYIHSAHMFPHFTCHPQGALMFLAKITGKTICKT